MLKTKLRLIGFEYVDNLVVTEIRRNLEFLFATREGSCPGDRSFGLDWNALDKPLPVAENLISLSIYEKVEKYEPRVIVDDIKFDVDAINGIIEATISVISAEDN